MSVLFFVQCGNEEIIRILLDLKNSGKYSNFLFDIIIVRFDLTIKSSKPILFASSTNHLKFGFISGAPPVKSNVLTPNDLHKLRHVFSVSLVIISFLSGPASTWQWVQT